MIAISTPLFDLDGHVIFRDLPSTDLGEVRRRVNRAKTLDGGVTINDGGHSPGDRTITVRWLCKSEAEFSAVQSLVQTYPRLIACTRGGVFTVVPESVSKRGREGRLTLLVIL